MLELNVYLLILFLGFYVSVRRPFDCWSPSILWDVSASLPVCQILLNEMDCFGFIQWYQTLHDDEVS